MMSLLKSQHVEEFQRQGYTMLLNGLSNDDLTMLHDEADELANYLMNEGYDILVDSGSIVEPLDCGYLDPPSPNDSYKTDLDAYIRRRELLTPGVSRFLTTTAAQWARALLYGDAHVSSLETQVNQSVYLLNEQYIIKPPRTADRSEFEWHRDSDYYRERSLKNESTVACWIALDDVSEENGTLLIGYLNDKMMATSNVKETVNIPAGSVVFMSSHLLHKSTGNVSARFRRAFMPQYSSIPMLDSATSLPVALAVPLFPTAHS